MFPWLSHAERAAQISNDSRRPEVCKSPQQRPKTVAQEDLQAFPGVDSVFFLKIPRIPHGVDLAVL